MKYLYNVVAAGLLSLTGLISQAQCTLNYLLNASFEAPVQSNNNGNNFPAGVSFNNWTITNVSPATPNPWNIVRVNGGGYTGGPNTAQQGLQYVDVNSAAGNVEQTFNLGCPATINFSGYFSSREASGYTNWTAQINILDASNAVVASSSTRTFTVADADGGTDAIWYQLSGTASLPAGVYTFSAVLGNFGNFDNAFLCAAPGCLLPTKLSYFGAEISNCVTKLKWIAESETDFNKYVVEYSRNGVDFSEAGFINAAQQGLPKTYFFQHTPPEGKSFYRLKLLDIDGRVNYSKTIAINSSCNNSSVLIYPNPVTDFLNINIAVVSSSGKMKAVLYNTQGQLLFNKPLASGTNVIDMRSIPSGIYSLQVIENDKISLYKIIK